ncbi:hypothetical protein CEUSTIGMA_g8387.t1 [Chlamydomonas eustigma]|uniref:3-dehydroquinate synthase n=1 Tax=Chlamydomonas eustigma TaxID=1157962 RepID=A0A250XDK2_9CHLO|nr:hypothetical protein CEUSTIGMA_g8387.t1 [Chlamydomonas eustigma]|eukprot:GAX80952.1 hypothetical protein CEUSTIGMA_g8387.t1 [Chlamydomonas eustigma]
MKEIVETAVVTCSQMQVQQDIILDFLFEWKVIPAESLVALIQQYIAAQSKPAMMIPRFFVVVSTASDALLMLTALEAGVDGVVLRTPSGSQVLNLVERMQHRQQQITQRGQQEGNGADTGMLLLTPVIVTKVVPLGSGHRVCVDLSSLMQPGEGLLVGSFSRGMFLVQSESEESEFINSRPFRVNAGPVHMYVHMPGGRTAYLSELKSGDEVMVVNSQGLQRPGLVGRVKVEARPLVLVEARGSDGQIYSLQLQNAETVKLIGPAVVGGSLGCHDALVSRMSPSSRDGEQATPGMSTIKEQSNNESVCSAAALLNSACWQAISVSELKEGDVVYTYLQEGARHTGLSISEFIIER